MRCRMAGPFLLPDSIKRFLRPLAFQNWPDQFLPAELKNGNPLAINRLVDGTSTKDSINANQ